MQTATHAAPPPPPTLSQDAVDTLRSLASQALYEERKSLNLYRRWIAARAADSEPLARACAIVEERVQALAQSLAGLDNLSNHDASHEARVAYWLAMFPTA